jgi:hypothetical protein
MNQVQRPRSIGSQTEKLVYFPRADGSRIPYKVYSSQEIYDLEQERIFRGPYMDPARVRGFECRRDVELGCSHISGLLVGHQMRPPALMDFRALRSLSVWRPRGGPVLTRVFAIRGLQLFMQSGRNSGAFSDRSGADFCSIRCRAVAYRLPRWRL